MAGKGDTRRPRFVDEETFADRWSRTFEGGHVDVRPGALELKQAGRRDQKDAAPDAPDRSV